MEEKTFSVTYKQTLKKGDDATAASLNLEVGWHAGPADSLARLLSCCVGNPLVPCALFVS